MGVRIVLADREPIGLALKRFRKLLERHRVAIWRTRYFVKQTQIRRAKEFRKRFKAREATFIDQRAGEQPASSIAEAARVLWTRTGKR